MQIEQSNDYEFRQAMRQWSDDHATNRLYGEGRWDRLFKKAGNLANEWNITDDWSELSPDDIVKISEYH